MKNTESIEFVLALVALLSQCHTDAIDKLKIPSNTFLSNSVHKMRSNSLMLHLNDDSPYNFDTMVLAIRLCCWVRGIDLNVDRRTAAFYLDRWRYISMFKHDLILLLYCEKQTGIIFPNRHQKCLMHSGHYEQQPFVHESPVVGPPPLFPVSLSSRAAVEFLVGCCCFEFSQLQLLLEEIPMASITWHLGLKLCNKICSRQRLESG